MEDHKFEREIEEALNKKTKDYLDDKEDIWSKLESQLNLKEQDQNTTSKRGKTKMSKRNFISVVVGAATIAFIIGLLTTTHTGQAFVEQIKQYFEPEKSVVTEIEGSPEDQQVILHEKADYVIYIDEERYKMIQEDERDVITTKEPLEERFPEVSMTIFQVLDQTPEQLADHYSKELKASFETVKEIETVTEPVNGLLVSAIDGSEWDSPVNRIYIISNGHDGSFVFELKYFLEAAEGHGARFYHMLEEFQIVPK
ncbi:MAG TPA: hypothetical protein VNQ57_06260 [Ureibacillus sp.]|nr:hypothetical protein [Ureibacillus sp.]